MRNGCVEKDDAIRYLESATDLDELETITVDALYGYALSARHLQRLDSKKRKELTAADILAMTIFKLTEGELSKLAEDEATVAVVFGRLVRIINWNQLETRDNSLSI